MTMTTSTSSAPISASFLVLATTASVALAAASARGQCPADLDANGVVNGADLAGVLAAWGPCAQCSEDLDGNGVVAGSDLGQVLVAWGECPVTVPSWATLVEARPDPAVVTDPKLRAAIAATGLAWCVRDTATQVEMLLVPPGTFQMGCTMGSDQYACVARELPSHQVTLTNAFYLGRYEVTQAQWTATMGSNPSNFRGQSDSPSRPVEVVGWFAIQGYLGATGFRLPTEAEWEYACRAGTQTPFYNGSTDDNTVGALAWMNINTCGGAPGCGTRPVGGRLANALGFHDMLGNVWEWVSDWYANYTGDAQTDPAGPASSTHRVLRGGAWLGDTGSARSSYRYRVTPGIQAYDVGFRVARTP